MEEQNEIVFNKRSLAKSTFSNMRKWLQGAATTTVSGNQQQQTASSKSIHTINYTTESAECQLKKLADLGLLFGLFQYSYQIYQTLKKDFANDQAWVCFNI